jgi:hypothetical protein
MLAQAKLQDYPARTLKCVGPSGLCVSGVFVTGAFDPGRGYASPSGLRLVAACNWGLCPWQRRCQPFRLVTLCN